MIKFVKEKLYFLKQWYVIVFTYPQERITVAESLDYDSYWKEKRGPVAGNRIRQITDNERKRAAYVADTIGSTEEVSVGDIACGPGVIYAYLKERLRLSEYTGYDSSEYALKSAESLGMTGIKFDISSTEGLAPIKQADYFILLEILEHIPHSEAVLDYVHKLARKGVFFSFPNSGNFLYRLRVLFGKMPAQWIKFPNEHLRFWTLTDLKWWLRAQGYTNFEIHCYRGIPLLEKIWPALFAGSFVVFLRK